MGIYPILRMTAGGFMLLAGLVGLVMPVLPGWLLIIPGIVLLGVRRGHIRNMLARCERRFPWTRPYLRRARCHLACEQKKKEAA